MHTKSFFLYFLEINNPTSSWKLILNDLVGIHFEYLLRCTRISKNISEKLPKVYRNNMHDLNNECNNKPTTISDFTHETLWFNTNITVDHNTVLWKWWFLSGIRYKRDMLDSVGNFLSQNKLNNSIESIVPLYTIW